MRGESAGNRGIPRGIPAESPRNPCGIPAEFPRTDFPKTSLQVPGVRFPDGAAPGADGAAGGDDGGVLTEDELQARLRAAGRKLAVNVFGETCRKQWWGKDQLQTCVGQFSASDVRRFSLILSER